jgi:hypothetical protein
MLDRPDRPVASLAVGLPLAAIFLLAPAATQSPAFATGAPPFCVMRGGSDGPGSSPEDCRYFDYQMRPQVAADMHENCVQNIDYHGSEVKNPPANRRVH